MYRVQDYISSGLDGKIVDLDGGIHENRLRAQKEKNKTPIIPTPLPAEGWTSSLRQLPPFNYGSLYAHLVTDSLTIPNNQRSAASSSFAVTLSTSNTTGTFCQRYDDRIFTRAFE